MSQVARFAARFAVVSESWCVLDGLDDAAQFAGNAKLRPALRGPGMDTRAGDFLVMDIP
jgi:hypothetical protein